jgi:arylsulfatase A-like enzyme
MSDLPNVIFITADSLRADRLGCYGYSAPTSPNIDRFAEDAVLFEHAFSNGPNTPHAFPAIMSATQPLDFSRLGLFDSPATLAEILQNAGYVTVGFNAANPYVSRMFEYDRGFDEFQDYMGDANLLRSKDDSSKNGQHIRVPDLNLEKYLISEESIHQKAVLENQVNRDIVARIGRVPRPFFFWVHYMDTHYPYLPQLAAQHALGMTPVSRAENFKINTRIRENMPLSPELLRVVENLYEAAIRQLDQKVADLFDFLNHRDLYDSSLIIFCADHGEEFQEHGDLQHKSKLFDELLHVPLLIKLPEAAVGHRRDDLVSLQQLPATILSVLGIDNPFPAPSLFQANSLGESNGNAYLIAEACYAANGGPPVDRQIFDIELLPRRYAYRDKFWKVIFDTARDESLLFNLVSDPFEKMPIHAPQVATPLLEMLNGHIRNQERARLSQRIGRVREKSRSMVDTF